MTSNRNGTSNWTLSGTEDLGGGLKAVFQVSTAFNPDTGTSAANALGNNGLFLGVTGGFGTLRAGRPVNTLYANAMFANGTKGVSGYDSNTLTAAQRGGLPASTAGVYVDNAVQYHSPRFGGVQVQVEWAPSEQTIGTDTATPPVTTSAKNDGFGVAVRYDGGPLSASLTSYKSASAKGATAKNGAVTQIAAAYDFGMAKVLFTYRDQGKVASNVDTAYTLGVTAPVGPGSAYLSYNVAEKATDDAKSIIAGYRYSLSKRTTAYVNVANGNKVLNVAGDNKSSNGYGFGLQHNF
jgi:predicted porin